MTDLTLARKEIDGRLEAIASQIEFEADNLSRVMDQHKRSQDNLAHLRDLHSQFLVIRESFGMTVSDAVAETRRLTSRSARVPIHRTEAGYPNCATCDGGGCLDCTDPA